MRSKILVIILCAFLINFVGLIIYQTVTSVATLDASDFIGDLNTKPRFLVMLPQNSEIQLQEPMAVAIGAKGEIYVTDRGSQSVVAFEPNGDFAFTFDGAKDGQNSFQYPYGIVTNNAGNILVSDPAQETVREFTPQGSYLKTLVASGQGIRPGLLNKDEQGNIYLSDLKNGRVLVFDSAGNQAKILGGPNNPLSFPQGIAVNESGIWVADSGNYALKIFTPENQLIKEVFNADKFVALRSLAVDRMGRILAADALTGLINVFDKTGNFLFSFGGEGLEIGSMAFPTGVTVSENLLLITERGKNRIQVWTIGKPE